MKYVRTKNYVFRVAEDIMLATSPMRYAVLDKKEDIRIGSICVNDAIAQSDTIEELCDEFVIDEIGHYQYGDFETAKAMLETIHEKGKLYGAIWTDRGLIYIAKMNEEGALELL